MSPQYPTECSSRSALYTGVQLVPRADHILQLQWRDVVSATAHVYEEASSSAGVMARQPEPHMLHKYEASSSAGTRPTVSLGRLRGADGLYGHSVLRAPAPSLTCFWVALLVLHGARDPEPAASTRKLYRRLTLTRTSHPAARGGSHRRCALCSQCA